MQREIHLETVGRFRTPFKVQPRVMDENTYRLIEAREVTTCILDIGQYR